MNASTLNEGTGSDSSCPPGASVWPGTMTGAVFLRRQQALLLRHLADVDRGVGSSPDAEAPAHTEWVALIAAAGDACGPEAAGRVGRLYEYHGRVAGSLERQRHLPLPPPAARTLRRLLATRLSELTSDAVDALSPKR